MADSPTDDDFAAWRDDRGPYWFADIGYSIQSELRSHIYDYTNRGDRLDDPGWHVCACGWQGYWVDFHPHVADRLRALLLGEISHRLATVCRAPVEGGSAPNNANIG